MADKKVKGSVIRGFLKYIERTWGEMGHEQCLEDIGLKMGQFEERKWYDIETLIAIHRWIGEKKGDKYIRRAGNYTVRDLGVLSYIVKFADVKSLLKKAPKSYEDAFNFGSVIIDVGENVAKIKMKGVKIDEYACLVWRGVFEGTLDATNTTGKVKDWHPEERGENDCYFIMEWE